MDFFLLMMRVGLVFQSGTSQTHGPIYEMMRVRGKASPLNLFRKFKVGGKYRRTILSGFDQGY